MSRQPVPPAPPVPPPPPPPVPAGSQKNIIFITTDDQDLMLGSMRSMPNTVRLIGEAGANLTSFRVNTPICCPSRSTMLTGRYEHNNKVSSLASGGCMHMNVSRFDNPEFWEISHPVRLHGLGYTTGLFGKVRTIESMYPGGAPQNPHFLAPKNAMGKSDLHLLRELRRALQSCCLCI